MTRRHGRKGAHAFPWGPALVFGLLLAAGLYVGLQVNAHLAVKEHTHSQSSQ